MDKIAKALARLSAKEREVVRQMLGHIQSEETRGLDIKKLKGRSDIFRIRKGDIRILYRIEAPNKVFILAIERRNENTYKF